MGPGKPAYGSEKQRGRWGVRIGSGPEEKQKEDEDRGREGLVSLLMLRQVDVFVVSDFVDSKLWIWNLEDF